MKVYATLLVGVILFQLGEAKLDRDEQGFKHPQADNAAKEGERNPKRGMNPQGGFVIDFDDGGQARDQKPNNHEGKKRRCIGGVMVFEHEVACATFIDNAEHILEEFALPTTRAAWMANLLEKRAHYDVSQ